ncbi:MAG: hypothetical protein AB1498_09120 [bacterium]
MFSLKFFLLYLVVFFIYLNFKLSLFFRFIQFGRKLSNKKDNLSYKLKKEIKKKAQEASEIELKMWYEDSIFKKVSQIEYSEKLARAKYEIFLEQEMKKVYAIKENNKKDKIEKQDKAAEEEKDTENSAKPLFTIKMKK